MPCKRRLAQEISLPWEPLETMGSKEMKKIALSWRFLVHLRMCEIVIWRYGCESVDVVIGHTCHAARLQR